MKIVRLGWALLAAFAVQSARADAIPYPSPTVYNLATYTFKATATGDVVAYFVGGTEAVLENQLGMLVNGVLTPAGYGLDNHTATIGQSFDLGSVTIGDTLTFVLHGVSLGMNAFSNPQMNLSYDYAGDTVTHNHIYSVPYTGSGPIFPGVPAGTYVGFEDEPIPDPDVARINYDDESFVFTNVTMNACYGSSGLLPQQFAALPAALVVADVGRRSGEPAKQPARAASVALCARRRADRRGPPPGRIA